MQVWNLLHAAHWKHRTQKVAKNRHLGTIPQLSRAISLQIRHVSIIRKPLLSRNMSSTWPHNMVNFCPLAAEIGLPVWGTPADFNGFRVLAALLHGSQVVSVSQPLRRWTEGASYVRQGDHHVGHWPTFLVPSIFLSSLFPRLISAVADWMSAILPHMVWRQCEFKMQVWKLLRAARWKHRTQKSQPKITIWPPSHNFVGLYLPDEGTYRQSENKLLSSNESSTCPHNMVNFGLLAAEIGLPVWGIHPNFNGLRVLAALLHSSKVVSVSQTLPRWRGRHLCSAGRPSHWAYSPHFYFSLFWVSLPCNCENVSELSVI